MGGTGAPGHTSDSTYKWQPIIGDCRAKNSVLGRNDDAPALPRTLTRLTSSSPTLWYTWHARLARLANSSKTVEFTLLAEPLCLRLAASVLALSRRKHVLHVTSQNRTPLIYETRTPRVETPIFHVEEFALGMHGSEHALETYTSHQPDLESTLEARSSHQSW